MSCKELARFNGINFFQLAKKETHPRVRIRYLALGHLQSGKTKTEITNMFQITFSTLRTWIARFIAEGLNGLKTKPGRRSQKK